MASVRSLLTLLTASMIHNLLRLLQWYTAVRHLMNPTPNNQDNLVHKMSTDMEGVTYFFTAFMHFVHPRPATNVL